MHLLFNFLLSHYTISVLAGIASTLVLMFSCQILYGRGRLMRLLCGGCGLANAVLIFLMQRIYGGFSNALVLLVITALLNLELWLVRRGKFLPCVYAFCMMLCDFSCIYVFSLAFLNFNFRHITYLTAQFYFSLAFSLSMTISIVFTSLLLLGGRPVIKMFSSVNNSLRQGVLVMSYAIMSDIIMLFAAFVLLPAVINFDSTQSIIIAYSIYEMFISLLILIVGFVVIFIQYKLDCNLREEKNLRYYFESASSLDSLTKILNRAAFEKAVENHIRTEGNDGTLIIIDLDHFKEVNDLLGHKKGDEVLKETTEILRKFFRGDDIIGRLGGDEFCVFCKSVTDKAFLEKRMASLNELGSNFYKNKNGDTVCTSFSIGLAVCPNDGRDFSALYGNADIALYKSKNTGKNKFSFYEDDVKLKFFDFDHDGLQLGIERIDDQHKRMMNLVNSLIEIISIQKSEDWKSDMSNILTELLGYAHIHFAYEEKLMQEAQFSGMELHKSQHSIFSRYASGKLAVIDEWEIADAEEMLSFLKSWLCNHIMEEDQMYCGTVKAYLSGETEGPKDAEAKAD